MLSLRKVWRGFGFLQAFVLAAFGLALLGQVAEASAFEGCRLGETRPGRVAVVPDGETLVLDGGIVIHLAGIEVPKPLLGQAGEDAGRLADLARSALADRVSGSAIAFKGREALDRHGRLATVVFLEDGRLVQGLLLDKGLARVRISGEAPSCVTEMLARETIARSEGLGLWAEAQYGVRDANGPSFGHEKGLYEIAEGRIYSVGHGSRMIFLNFGGNWRRDLTVLIAPALATRLSDTGRPVDGMKGRRVRVRGVLEFGRGPFIRLGDPAQIEVLGD